MALRPADREHDRVHPDEVREAAGDRGGEPARVQRGYNYGETSEDFLVQYEVQPASLAPGLYRQITGNQALAYGLIAASAKSELPLFLGAYPITPASGSSRSSRTTRNSACGRSRPRTRSRPSAPRSARASAARSVCAHRPARRRAQGRDSRPGGNVELPLVIIDVQRAGSVDRDADEARAGRPPMVLYGRNSESPVPVVAAATPGDCFDCALEAVRISVKYRTPVYCCRTRTSRTARSRG